MHYILRPVRKAQNHIMVLASIESGAEKFRTVKKFSVKHAEMTDIIICPQIVHCIIRFEMHSQHLVYIATLKSSLIAVQIIRILLIYCFNVFIQYARMENIVMIEQPYIFSC